VSPKIRGFVVTTRYKPAASKQFMVELVERYPETRVFKNDVEIEDGLYRTDPDQCCDILKVQPVRRAIEEMGVSCWVTGLRCTEGRTRTDYLEVEERDEGLLKLNPILLWHEREIWQYIALNQVPVNQLYAEGYRSLGCEPCTHITTGSNERDGDNEDRLQPTVRLLIDEYQKHWEDQAPEQAEERGVGETRLAAVHREERHAVDDVVRRPHMLEYPQKTDEPGDNRSGREESPPGREARRRQPPRRQEDHEVGGEPQNAFVAKHHPYQ
jgi:phosphoadenylyl-sulfate reductase (thioredoxin)